MHKVSTGGAHVLDEHVIAEIAVNDPDYDELAIFGDGIPMLAPGRLIATSLSWDEAATLLGPH